MNDPITLLTMSGFGFGALCLASAAALKGWRGWLDLKRLEVAGRPSHALPLPAPVARIEMADLKERVRKLEAIASGMDY